MLFDGEVRCGALSNVFELVELVPEEFSPENEWYQYVEHLYAKGGQEYDASWKARSDFVESLWYHTRKCFKYAFMDSRIPREKRFALCGWMLSEMLAEVPEH